MFLDEVTLMEISDGVLSGTDFFLFTEDEQLYDRCILLHTTFIPYREFESVLGIHASTSISAAVVSAVFNLQS